MRFRASDSYLTLDLRGKSPSLRWDIAVRDVEWTRRIPPHDLIESRPLVHVFVEFFIVQAPGRCPRPDSQRRRLRDAAKHSAPAWCAARRPADTVLEAALACAQSGPVSIDYRLLFDLDPTTPAQVQLIERWARVGQHPGCRRRLPRGPALAPIHGRYWREWSAYLDRARSSAVPDHAAVAGRARSKQKNGGRPPPCASLLDRRRYHGVHRRPAG